MKRVTKFIAYSLIMVFGLAAGAGCQHHMTLYERQQERKVEMVTYREEMLELEEKPDDPDVCEKMLSQKKNQKDDQIDLRMEEYYDSLGLLASCVEAEAGNQSMIGKRLVVDVILNRVDDPDWPDSIEGVITQPGQFTTWQSGSITRADPTEETYEAVRMELEDRLCGEIYYFTAGNYGAYGEPWGCVGDHYFSGK